MGNDKGTVENYRTMVTRLFGLPCSVGGAGSTLLAGDHRYSDLTVETPGRDAPADPDDRMGQTTVFTWPDLGTFTVRDGHEITTDLSEDTDPTYIRNVLAGISFGELLRQRGYLVFHGSVVEIDGHTVAFVGNKRAGKSTSAAALLARGHELLSDDIVAVRFDGETPLVTPGFPMFKFDPDAFDDDPLPAHPAPNPETGYGKRYYELDGEFDWTERPLSTITLLDPGEEEQGPESLTGHDALMAVLEHAWPVRLRTASYVDHDRSTIEGPDLDRYARLVENCRVQRVSLDHNHESLSELGRDLESILGEDR